MSYLDFVFLFCWWQWGWSLLSGLRSVRACGQGKPPALFGQQGQWLNVKT